MSIMQSEPINQVGKAPVAMQADAIQSLYPKNLSNFAVVNPLTQPIRASIPLVSTYVYGLRATFEKKIVIIIRLANVIANI